MREAGRILASVHQTLGDALCEGMSTLEIDTLGEEIIRSFGCEPSFLNYMGYPASVCVSVNDEVVHGIPREDHIITNGDIVSLDIGVIYKGYHSDAARTHGVGEISPEAQALIDVTRESFFAGIEQATAGRHLNDISSAIGDYATKRGYGVVRDLVGHGIGTHLHEEPEMTPEGELGVDPTAVTLNLNLAMNLSLAERAPVTITRASETNYLRRFIVEAYLDRQVAARQTVYEEDFNRASLSVSMKLHARNYRILVWADYVNAETPEQGLVYDAENLAFILPAGKYIGNSRYKDVFAASAMADLTSFRNHWGAETSLDVELYRPVARYELVAKDVATFLNKLSTGGLKGESFTARVKYSDYLPTGYNLWDDVPKNSLMYMEYKVAFERPADGTKELILGFDYVLTDAGETVSIPVELEILNEKNEVLARTAFRVPCERGKNTTVRGNFLTSDANGGIGIDPDYDGDLEVDLGEL